MFQFIRRQNVLSLYRDYMRVTSKIENETHRNDMKRWIRSEFDAGKTAKDAELIQMSITRAKDGLRELRVTMEHAHVS